MKYPVEAMATENEIKSVAINRPKSTNTNKTLSELFVSDHGREKVVDQALRESIVEQKELLTKYRVSAKTN